ncbi:hypothetical protein MKW92_004206, partial [Papaver armeniacum]
MPGIGSLMSTTGGFGKVVIVALILSKKLWQDPFPLHAICGAAWSNAEGKISFLRYAVSASPEIFTFVRSARQLVYADAIHGHKLSPGMKISLGFVLTCWLFYANSLRWAMLMFVFGEGAWAVCACLMASVLQSYPANFSFTCNPFTFIEHALATISSSHSESNGRIIVPMDQHQGPNPVPFENME